MSATHPSLYPLIFVPLYKDYLWGGQQLHTKLGKQTGPGVWAESWEVVDHQATQSVVANGAHFGRTLQELMHEFQAQLVGQAIWEKINSAETPPQLRGRFPLLIKFLDAAKDLSVQVHPNDGQASRLNPPDLGKTEAWYVIEREPGSRIFSGLIAGTSREQFQDAIERGETEMYLSSFQPEVGDCVFVPAGTQHAIGAGLLILEVQQASDTTFRVFDWNRLDPQGQRRELHIRQALAVTDFSAGPVFPQSSKPNAWGGQELVTCSYFTIHEHRGGQQPNVGQVDRFEIQVVIRGAPTVSGLELVAGQTVLLPPTKTGFECMLSDGDEILRIWIP